jgi:hypothetical protein
MTIINTSLTTSTGIIQDGNSATLRNLVVVAGWSTAPYADSATGIDLRSGTIDSARVSVRSKVTGPAIGVTVRGTSTVTIRDSELSTRDGDATSVVLQLSLLQFPFDVISSSLIASTNGAAAALEVQNVIGNNLFVVRLRDTTTTGALRETDADAGDQARLLVQNSVLGNETPSAEWTGASNCINSIYKNSTYTTIKPFGTNCVSLAAI